MNYFSLILLALLFTACVKDKPDSPAPNNIQLGSSKVYVINEGPFQTGNGSISLYDPKSGDVVENFYKAQNNAELGNIVQSMNAFNGNYYIVVNYSNKIIVCDGGFKKIGQMNGFNSPRYILPVTNQKAYVSDLYAKAIHIVDLNSNAKTSEIRIHSETERMALIYNKAFITAPESDYLYVINTLTDAKSDSIPVGKGVSSLVIDRNDKVWTVGYGDSTVHAPGKLTRINSVTGAVELTLSFHSGELPSNLCLNKTKDTLYFLNNNIYRMSIADAALPAAAFVEHGSRTFYGLGVNPKDYGVYVSDAIDYNQKSNIYIFGADGHQKTVFKAGLISNGFYFE